MNKNFFSFFLFTCLLSFCTSAQDSSITDIWLLIDKQHLKGPTYQNGVPKILTTYNDGNGIRLALTTALALKDTVELENFEAVRDYTIVSMTSKGRQKKIHLDVSQIKNLWIRQVNMSSRDNINHPEIKIVDSLKFSEDRKHVTLVRQYIGTNRIDGNLDYVMQGTYKKVTPEQLVQETTTGKGVVWTTGLSWAQVLEKAKQENKYVFVDCYATWCTPCKKMDAQVFPFNWVGETMNKHFIAVKVQMDTGRNDPHIVRRTYPIARLLEKQYKIDGLPTYLFLNGSGELVDQAVGIFDIPGFVAMLENAANPRLQVYTQYRLAVQGELPLNEIKALIGKLLNERYNDKEKAKTLMRIYIYKKFNTLGDKELLTKDNIEEIFTFWSAVKSTDRIFKLLYHNTERIDSILNKKKGEDYVEKFLEGTVMYEEVIPVVNKAMSSNTVPNWNKLETNIVRKFGKSYSVRPILNAQVWLYRKYKQWNLYCKYLLRQVQVELPRIKAGEDPSNPINNLTGLSNYLNEAAWNMFLYSTNKEQLEAALNWARQAVELASTQKMPYWAICSTYGNVLYKLGRKDEAISFYKKMVLDRLPENARGESNNFVRTFVRMQQDKPTWEERNKWLK